MKGQLSSSRQRVARPRPAPSQRPSSTGPRHHFVEMRPSPCSPYAAVCRRSERTSSRRGLPMRLFPHKSIRALAMLKCPRVHSFFLAGRCASGRPGGRLPNVMAARSSRPSASRNNAVFLLGAHSEAPGRPLRHPGASCDLQVPGAPHHRRRVRFLLLLRHMTTTLVVFRIMLKIPIFFLRRKEEGLHIIVCPEGWRKSIICLNDSVRGQPSGASAQGPWPRAGA